MSEVKWIKLLTEMFDDEKIKLIEAVPEADMLLVIWIKLLTLAGKKNMNGYIFLTENIPYTDEMLATLFNRPLNTVRLALETFKKFGMIEFNGEGKIKITNWEKHQNIEGLERIREQNKLRVSKYRKRLEVVGGTNYQKHWVEVFKRDKGMCVYCGTTENIVLDHLIPLIQSGDNEIDNIVLACKSCNAGKSGKLIEDASYIKIINEDIIKQYEIVKKRIFGNNVTQTVTLSHAPDKIRLEKNRLDLLIDKSETFMSTWVDFKDMRKKLKKSMTLRAEELILKELNKLTINEKGQIAILNQSIMNSWLGVFPLKGDYNGKINQNNRTGEEKPNKYSHLEEVY